MLGILHIPNAHEIEKFMGAKDVCYKTTDLGGRQLIEVRMFTLSP